MVLRYIQQVGPPQTHQEHYLRAMYKRYHPMYVVGATASSGDAGGINILPNNRIPRETRLRSMTIYRPSIHPHPDGPQ